MEKLKEKESDETEKRQAAAFINPLDGNVLNIFFKAGGSF